MIGTPLEQNNPLHAGQVALGRAAWQEARGLFEAALVEQETPEALEGLGLAAWWLDLAAVVFDARERAYRAYRGRIHRLSLDAAAAIVPGEEFAESRAAVTA